MRKPLRTLLSIAFGLLILSSTPAAAAAPSDPTTLDEIRDSVAYRSDHADVLRLYRAFFNREPDVAGVSYWMGIYDQGASLDDLAWGFSNSTEFITAYGATLTNRDFLSIVYGNVLDRTPDNVGMDYWLGQMSAGVTQHGVVRWVAANDEFTTRHPYTDLRADLDTTLFTLNDLDTGWILDPDQSRSEPTDACRGLARFPERASVRTFYRHPDYGPYLTHAVYSFPTTAEAINELQRQRTRTAECSSYTSDGFAVTLAPMAFTDYGDDTFATRVTSVYGDWEWFQDGILVRYGSTIIAIAHTDLFSVNTYNTEEWIAEAVNRVRTLAGP